MEFSPARTVKRLTFGQVEPGSVKIFSWMPLIILKRTNIIWPKRPLTNVLTLLGLYAVPSRIRTLSSSGVRVFTFKWYDTGQPVSKYPHITPSSVTRKRLFLSAGLPKLRCETIEGKHHTQENVPVTCDSFFPVIAALILIVSIASILPITIVSKRSSKDSDAMFTSLPSSQRPVSSSYSLRSKTFMIHDVVCPVLATVGLGWFNCRIFLFDDDAVLPATFTWYLVVHDWPFRLWLWWLVHYSHSFRTPSIFDSHLSKSSFSCSCKAESDTVSAVSFSSFCLLR